MENDKGITMNSPINLAILFEASHFWEMKGFEKTTVPLYVDEDVMEKTCPPDVRDGRIKHTDGKSVVASAEQSFLQMDKEGELPIGKLQALTPCYRDEAKLDDIHKNVFLKLELYNPTKDKKTGERESLELARDMTHLLHHLGLPFEHMVIVSESGGFDVKYKGVELGSYGVRQNLSGDWYVYGTGLAEPRTSLALEKASTRK